MLVSGGFDPIHSGHVRLIRAAREFGRLYIALLSDRLVRQQRGSVLMPWEERAEILRAISGVWDVLEIEDSDGTVCRMLARVKPHIFAFGGDGKRPHPAEHDVCKRLGIREVYEVGEHKIPAVGA